MNKMSKNTNDYKFFFPYKTVFVVFEVLFFLFLLCVCVCVCVLLLFAFSLYSFVELCVFVSLCFPKVYSMRL